MRLFVEKGTVSLTVSELAQAANVARGTLYRKIGSIENLFDRIVDSLRADLDQRVSAAGGDDPVVRLANGIRLWIRYAHDNPLMGRFAVRFALNERAVRTWMAGPATADLEAGFRSGRYSYGQAEIGNIASLIVGATVSAMWTVLEGHQTWRDAGSLTAEFVLRALGVPSDEAHAITTIDLP